MSDETRVPQPVDGWRAPEETGEDHAHSATALGFALLPLLGGPAAVLAGPAAALFELAVMRPVERRRVAWLNTLASRLLELNERVDGLAERLAGDPAFHSALMHATQIADRTHQGQKLEALRNAVLNTALRSAPDAEVVAVFLRLVDQFTEWHLRILAVLESPAGQGADLIHESTIALGAQWRFIHAAYPELTEERDLILQIHSELRAAGLVVGESSVTRSTPGGPHDTYTTARGRAFLAFIREPPKEAAANQKEAGE